MFGLFQRRWAPAWFRTPPPAGSFRSIFKWGAPDGFKEPNRRLLALLQEELGLIRADLSTPRYLGLDAVRLESPPSLDEAHVRYFAEALGPENLGQSGYERVKYAHGQTMEEIFVLRRSGVEAAADLVVHPRTRDDVVRIVGYCHDQRIPLYVYGGGSSVNLGFRPKPGGVTLVTQTHLNRFIELNEENQTATVQAGIMGPAYEAFLNEAPSRLNSVRSYTGGHFPQSFEYSTVGGWIAALGSGQESSYYGDAADLVAAQEYVTPAGVVRTLGYPAAATGPRIDPLLMGGEGSYGVLVSATLKVFRHMPQNRRRFAFLFPSWDQALAAAREISQGEFGRPSVFRVSDPEETNTVLKLYGVDGHPLERLIRHRGLEPGSRCLMLGRADGEAGFARNLFRCVRRICRGEKGMYLTGYPVKAWEHGRYSDPYLRDALGDFGIVIDTLETSVRWDQVRPVHQAVRSFLKERPGTMALAHSSHFYPQGTNLYFIFIARMDDVAEYRSFQRGVIDRIEAAGGSLSHHHGVGRMMGDRLEGHLGPVAMGALKALKNYFDPRGVMNPGGLGL